ncbi:MAG: NAD(P)H-dependent oxidoreductase [Candidatus Methanoplasma sp.]|jgi:chromate reductase|nr:NAD(P)H-dependent oxidoreductase [Candidatus Methanoplasma sp.]
MTSVGIFVGSLRKGSYSRKIAENVAKILEKSMNVKFIDISKLELYNQDFDDDGVPPGSWSDYRRELKGFDAFLFVTPEYNRSIPGVLKNAIDVASKPAGQSGLAGKPAGIISVSPGRIGAFGANHHLRQAVVFLDVHVMQQPEAYIGEVASAFNEEGEISDERTRENVQNFADAFLKWVAVFHKT